MAKHIKIRGAWIHAQKAKLPHTIVVAANFATTPNIKNDVINDWRSDLFRNTCAKIGVPADVTLVNKW